MRRHLDKTSPVEEGISKNEILDAIYKGKFSSLVARRLKATDPSMSDAEYQRLVDEAKRKEARNEMNRTERSLISDLDGIDNEEERKEYIGRLKRLIDKYE